MPAGRPERSAPPVPPAEGDVFLPEASGHALADDPRTPAVDVTADRAEAGRSIGTLTVGPRTRVLCGAYHLDRVRPHPLVGHLPEVIHLRSGEHPQLTAAVDLLGFELDHPRAGSNGIVVDSLLLYILWAWLDGQATSAAAGWVLALSDRPSRPP